MRISLRAPCEVKFLITVERERRTNASASHATGVIEFPAVNLAFVTKAAMNAEEMKRRTSTTVGTPAAKLASGADAKLAADGSMRSIASDAKLDAGASMRSDKSAKLDAGASMRSDKSAKLDAGASLRSDKSAAPAAAPTTPAKPEGAAKSERSSPVGKSRRQGAATPKK